MPFDPRGAGQRLIGRGADGRPPSAGPRHSCSIWPRATGNLPAVQAEQMRSRLNRYPRACAAVVDVSPQVRRDGTGRRALAAEPDELGMAGGSRGSRPAAPPAPAALLDTAAAEMSDNDAARALNRARDRLFASIDSAA